MRGYTVITSAVALQVDYKWLDNLLSHNNVEGVRQARQGVSRTLTLPALRAIAVTRELLTALHCPLPQALGLARRLLSGENPVVEGPVSIGVNVEHVDRYLLERLAFAVEVSPVPRRGRPPIGR